MKPEIIELPVADHCLAAVCLNPGVTGEPVILVHGITGAISFWQVNPARYLLENGPCYSLSLPGHYPAVAPAAFSREPLSADCLVSLMGEAVRGLVGRQPATLIGHSTGGFSVLALAARYPELVRRVISISGFAHGRWTRTLGIAQRMVRLGWPGEAYFKFQFGMLKRSPRLFKWAMRFYTADARAHYASPDVTEAIRVAYPDFQQIDLGVVLPYFQYMPDIDITPWLSRIQVPTLVVTGDRDPIVPPEQSYQIARLVKGADLVVLQGAGHLPFTERREPYHSRMMEWLDRTR